MPSMAFQFYSPSMVYNPGRHEGCRVDRPGPNPKEFLEPLLHRLALIPVDITRPEQPCAKRDHRKRAQSCNGIPPTGHGKRIDRDVRWRESGIPGELQQ